MTTVSVYNTIRFIPYVCLLVVGLLILAILMAAYFSYRLSKLGLYNHPLYISVANGNIDEIKQWLDENINGRVWIESDIHKEGDWMSGPQYEHLRGWTFRFMKPSDAMAFKLVWITKNGRDGIL